MSQISCAHDFLQTKLDVIFDNSAEGGLTQISCGHDFAVPQRFENSSASFPYDVVFIFNSILT